jgi:hypothetical protein
MTRGAAQQSRCAFFSSLPKNSMWRITNQCPQCGADTCLEETQRLFTCPFCRVKLFIAVDDYFRYVLPLSFPSREEAIFVPYWRLKGMYFSYDGAAVQTGLLDVSHNATRLEFLPASLGLRSQTLRLKFLSPEIQGSFLKHARSCDDILKTLEDPLDPEMPLLSEKTFMGESVSMIFSPIFVRNRAAYDGILGEKIAALPEAVSKELLGSRGKAEGTMSFLPSLCPDCGWDMEGDPESVVLTCGNCRSAWSASRKGFEKVPCSFLPLEEDALLYLPFWRIEAEIKGVPLGSYADAVRFFNLPKAVRREWEQAPFCWLAPAFKIHPDLFLKVAQRMTFQAATPFLKGDLPGGSLYPVTLPWKDAFESLRIILAQSAVNKKDMAGLYPSIGFALKAAELLYWPFHLSGLELIRPDRQLSIQANALKWGKHI